MNRYGLELHALDSYFQMVEISAPGTPETNNIRLYAKDSGGISTICYKNDAGTEICFPTTGVIVGDPVGGRGSGVDGQVAVWDGTDDIEPFAATAGSVFFAGVGGILAQDNANFFWDDSANRLGIGTATPADTLNILKSGAIAGAILESYNTTGSNRAIWTLRTATGTSGSPGNVATGNQLGEILAAGYAGGAFRTVAGVTFEVGAGSISGTSLPSHIRFETTPDGSVSRTTRFQIGPSGQWGIGGSTYGGSGDIFSSGGASGVPTWVTRATLNAALDHGTLSGNGDDDHTQYALLAGRSGGQTLIGGTAASNKLVLQSTSNATRGDIDLDGGDLTFTSSMRARMASQNRFRHLNIWGKVSLSTSQSITVPSTHLILWDTNKYVSEAGVHSTSSNTSRLVAPIAGKYLVGCNVSGDNTIINMFIDVYVNGAVTGGGRIGVQGNVPTTGGWTIVNLAANDYVEFKVNIAATTPATVLVGDDTQDSISWAGIQYIGE